MIICGDRILVGDRKTIIEGGAICIIDGMIKMVGSCEKVKASFANEPVEEYQGATIMPGMIDLHVHLGFPIDSSYNNPYNGVSMRALYATRKMEQTLIGGVTTIRDCTSADGLGMAIKKVTADGYIKSPRIFTCLQGICMTGGHGSGEIEGSVIEADGVEEIRKAVRINLKNGADCIKVLTSEGYRGQELSQQELNAAAHEAHRFGLKIAAHAGYGDSIQMCIDAGFDSIEHGTHLSKQQAIYMKEHNITWVPTIMVFNYVYNQLCDSNGASVADSLKNQALYLNDCVNTYQENVKKIYDTGVRIATGTDTDCINYEGASPVATECDYLVKCGLSPLEAIECATKNGADYLGLSETLGQIKEGYIADVIVVDGNPANDIDALKNVTVVYQSGKKVSGL